MRLFDLLRILLDEYHIRSSLRENIITLIEARGI